MSAFLCSDLHINTLANYATLHDVRVRFNNTWIRAKDEPARIASLLYTANVESVNQRYDEDSPSTGFAFEHLPVLPAAVNVIKLCRCFDYQACEVPDYETTIAAAIIRAIINAAAHQLPGYDAARWAI